MNRIKQLRKERNITIEELANAIDSNRGSISRYELGDVEMKIDICKRIADYFCVSIDYLLGYSNVRNIIDKDN